MNTSQQPRQQQQSPTCLTHLPDELLILIAEFLHLPDILHFANVGKRFLGVCANGIAREKELRNRYRDVYLGPALGTQLDLPGSDQSYGDIYVFVGRVTTESRYDYVRNIHICLDPVEESRTPSADAVFMPLRPLDADDRPLCKRLQIELERRGLPWQEIEVSQTNPLLLPILPDLLRNAAKRGCGEALLTASMPLFSNLRCLTLTSRFWDGLQYWECIDRFFQFLSRMQPQKYLTHLDSLVWDPCTGSTFQNIRSIMCLPSMRYVRLQGCHERNDDDSAYFDWPEGCPYSSIQEIVMIDPRISKAGLERVLTRIKGPCVVKVQGISLWRENEDTRWTQCTKQPGIDGAITFTYDREEAVP